MLTDGIKIEAEIPYKLNKDLIFCLVKLAESDHGPFNARERKVFLKYLSKLGKRQYDVFRGLKNMTHEEYMNFFTEDH